MTYTLLEFAGHLKGAEIDDDVVVVAVTPLQRDQLIEAIHRSSERTGALVEALKFTTECLESYSFSRGIDPRTASPDSAIGKARAALAAVKGEPKA